MSTRFASPASSRGPFSKAYLSSTVESLDPSDAAPQRDLVDSPTNSDVASHEDFGEDLECKYEDAELMNTRTPLLTGNDVNAKREEIREYFHKTFSLYEKLFSVLASDSTYFMQPELLRHPLIFYAGHTAVFFINKLRLAGLLTARINEQLESTLAIGVDEMSWDDLNVGSHIWPSVEQVRNYRDMARVAVDDLISSLPLTLPITWDQPFWIILMGCEHERIHLETSSVLFRQLPIDQVKAVPMWDHCVQFRAKPEEVPTNSMLSVPGGVVVAGKSQETQTSYGWDLEYGSQTSTVAPFEAAKFLTSNAEFYEFVCDGGYEDQSLWGEEGWKFILYRKATCPVFWVPVEQTEEESEAAAKLPAVAQKRRPQFRYRTMTKIIDMPWDWPVDCNYIESKAFCEWKNRQRARDGSAAASGQLIRLPTEAEYMRLRDHAFPEREVDPTTGVERINDQPFWASAPGNINMEHGASSCPIDRFSFGHGFHDVVGNVWQWTETPLMPYRGFQFHPMYDDFSVPTFDTRHNVFVGGSWASTGNEATRAARFAFRRHFYQHAGFRYVIADALPATAAPSQTAMCETDPAVVHMMDAQFNDAALASVQASLRMQHQPNHAVTLAKIAVDTYKQHASVKPTEAGPRVLDVGCACGRSTFELAKLAAGPVSSSSTPSSSSNAPLFGSILGLDFSTRFIRIAAQLQFEGQAQYNMRREGDLSSYHSIESRAGAPEVTAAPATKAFNVAVSTAPSILDLDLTSIGMQSRVEFQQGDACNLASKYSNYDLVLAGNLLEFLYAPRQFLSGIGARMRSGGILILASSFAWDDKVTPKEHWLGGVKDLGGESVDSARTVAELLASEFEPLSDVTQELPMLWKLNQRNYQLKIAQVTAWKRK